MKKFCKDLREHPIKITNSAEKEMISLTTKENKSYQIKKSVIYAKKVEIIKLEIIVILLEK